MQINKVEEKVEEMYENFKLGDRKDSYKDWLQFFNEKIIRWETSNKF